MECGSLCRRWPLCNRQKRTSGGKGKTPFNHRAFGCQNALEHCVERSVNFEFLPQLEVATAVSLHSRADHKWQKQRNKRSDSLDLESSPLDFSAQFGAAVAAPVHRVLIDGAPQEPMLRHRDENAAAG